MWGMRRSLPFVVGLLALSSCTDAPPGDRSAPSGAALPANAIVDHVVDGDTVVVTVDDRTETVRLIGIDTPETVKPDAPVECYGPEAAARTHALLPDGTDVRLVRDAEPRDVYGRLLAYVYRAADGLFVNVDLVAGGYAEPFPFAPNTAFSAEFVAAARTAEAQGRGLWAACGTP